MLALRAARLLPSLHCKYHHVLPRRALFGGQKEEPVSIYSKWAQHFPDDILLVEMGKFFELRDEAARRAASKLPLQVRVTSRSGWSKGEAAMKKKKKKKKKKRNGSIASRSPSLSLLRENKAGIWNIVKHAHRDGTLHRPPS